MIWFDLYVWLKTINLIERSQHVHHYVHHMFILFSSHVHHMFTIRSTHVQNMFTECSRHVQDMLTTCSRNAYNMFTTCSRHVHNMFTTCSCKFTFIKENRTTILQLLSILFMSGFSCVLKFPIYASSEWILLFCNFKMFTFTGLVAHYGISKYQANIFLGEGGGATNQQHDDRPNMPIKEQA